MIIMSNNFEQYMHNIIHNSILKIIIHKITIVDVELQYISKLKKMQYLDINGCSSITDIGLESISNLKNLQYHDVNHCPVITDIVLLYVSHLQNLKYFKIEWIDHIKDKGLIMIRLYIFKIIIFIIYLFNLFD